MTSVECSEEGRQAECERQTQRGRKNQSGSRKEICLTKIKDGRERGDEEQEETLAALTESDKGKKGRF